tara:strand:+ start:24 stop:395 length:372 start_codon:yes stop_codon:yes gene_type:complete
MLLIAAALTVMIGLYHSLAGEQRLIRPLLALDTLPRLRGSTDFTRALIRTAWHITTLAWFGLAGILIVMDGQNGAGRTAVLGIIAVVFAVSGIAALIFGRGRHPAWLAFLPIAGLSGFTALQG